MTVKNNINPILLRKERLALLRELNLVTHERESIYDRLTQLSSTIINVPVSLMSMVASDKQVFKSQFGLGDPWAAQGETPLSHSFCQHVVTTNKPLIVTDAREDDMLKTNLAIRDLNVIGYLGIPITPMDGLTLGSFCVIDNEPRKWSYVEIALVQELAEILTREIDLRAKARLDAASYERKVSEADKKIDTLIDQLDTNQSKEDMLTQLRALRENIDI